MKYLVSEWKILQKQVDDYERWSLVIKLCHLFALLIFVNTSVSLLVGVLIMSSLWLQESIWKTYQARSEERLIILEEAILDNFSQNSEKLTAPFQFNRNFIANRPSTLRLLNEYFKQALRPTVAFPHIVFIGIFILQILFS